MNNMREGSLDKIVYEAASTCMPVLASNTGFDDSSRPSSASLATTPTPWRSGCVPLAAWTGMPWDGSCASGSSRAIRRAAGPTA